MTPSTGSSTATTHAARAHARAQAGTAAATQPTVPARTATDRPSGVAAEAMIWEETLGPGGAATHRLPRGARLRLLDVEGDACVALVLHRADARDWLQQIDEQAADGPPDGEKND